MAYNKNKKMFKSSTALKRGIEAERNEMLAKYVDLKTSMNKHLEKMYGKQRKKNENIKFIIKYINDTNGIDFTDVGKLYYDNLDDFGKGYAHDKDKTELENKTLWNEAVDILLKIKEKEAPAYERKMAAEEINLQLKTVFNSNSSRVGKNIERIIFKKDDNRDIKYETAEGVKIINEIGGKLVNMMAPGASKQTGKQLMYESVSNNLLLTGNSLGKANQSLESIRRARENLRNTNNLVVFDLETFGGKNVGTNINVYDRITEFSFNKNGVSETAVMGFDRKTANEYLSSIQKAMQMGQLDPSSLLGVTASRLALYGDAEIEFKDGVAVVKSFPGDDFDDLTKINMEQLERGAKKLVEAYENTEMVDFVDATGQTRRIKKDVKMLLDNTKHIQDIYKNGTGVVAGFNHLNYDIPFLNSQLQKMYNGNDKNVIAYMDNIFKGNIFLDPRSNGTNLDVLSIVTQATEAYGIDAMYANNQEMLLKMGSRPNRQEYIGELYQRKLFYNADGTRKAEAHKADYDTLVLKNLIMDPIDLAGNPDLKNVMNIPETYTGSAIDYMLDYMTKEGYDDKQGGILRRSKSFEFNLANKNNVFFMMNGSDRASGALGRGQGHLDFSYDPRTGEYHFANRAMFEKETGEAVTNSFYKGMNKEAVYRVSDIKRFDISSLGEASQRMFETYSEYASGQAYALELAGVSTSKGSDLANRRHVKIFKTFEEMEAFLSTQMDVVATVGDNGEVELNHHYKQLLATNRNKAGADDAAILKDYINFADEKIAKDNARRYLFHEDKSFERVQNVLKFLEYRDKNANISNMSMRELSLTASQAVTKAKNGQAIYGVEKDLYETMKKTVGYKFNGTQQIKTSTMQNAINSLAFVKENRALLQAVTDEINSTIKRKDGRYYLAHQSRETGSDILNNVLKEIIDEHQGSGMLNEVSERQKFNTYDVRVKGIYNRRNTSTMSNGIADLEDVISITDLHSTNAGYSLLSRLVNAQYGTKAKDLQGEAKLNTEKAVIEMFMKNADFEYKNEMRGLMEQIEDGEDFNPLDAAKQIVSLMRKDKYKNGNSAGLIKLKTNESLGNLNANHIDNAKLIETLKNDPDYIRNMVKKYSNIKILDERKDSFTENAKNAVDKLIDFNFQEVKSKIRNAYGSTRTGIGKKELTSKSILFENAKRDIRNMVADLYASANEAGAQVHFNDDTGTYSVVKGNQIVDVLLPKLKMADNGMMYIKLGNQNIKLRHKVLVSDKGEVSLGTSINDFYREATPKPNSKYPQNDVLLKNQRRVKNAIEDGTFELGDIASFFKRDLKFLTEDSKMVTINGGDYYSNMNLDAKEFITKGVYAIFGENVKDDEFPEFKKFRDAIIESKFYDENFAEEFKRRFGKQLNGEQMPPDAFLYMAREAPLMLREMFRATAVANGSSQLSELAEILNIGSKKQETESGVYSVGEQRGLVLLSDAWNNMARPVSGGSGNFYFIKKNEDALRVKNQDSLTIRKGALISNQHYDAINSLIENGEEYVSSARVRTVYTGDVGLDAILNYQFNEVLESNTVKNNASKMQYVTNAYAQMRANISVFEQQKIMDPLAFEKMVGNNTPADTKFFSTNLDLIGALTETSGDISQKDLEMRQRILDLIPDIRIENGKVVYSSKGGQFVTRNDRVFTSKGFGGVNDIMNSKLKAGILNFGVKNAEGVDITDENLSNILTKHIDEIRSASYRQEATSIALNILEREGYSFKFSVKDINKLTLPKLNSGSGEKSMTTLLYAKTGSVDSDVRNLFESIEKSFNVGVDNTGVRFLDNTVLTEDATKVILDKYLKSFNSEADFLKATSAFGGSNVKARMDDILTRVAEEQMSFRNMLFGFGKMKGISAISNDAIIKHGNIGMILENNLANALEVLSKYMDGSKGDKYDQALDFVINQINHTDKDGKNPYAIFKNETISGLDSETGEYKTKMKSLVATKGANQNINFEGMRFLDEEHTVIDGTALNALIRRIDDEINTLSNGKRDKDDRLYVAEYHRLNPKTGKLERVKGGFEGQGLFLRGKDGEDVMAGIVLTDIETVIKDPETQTDNDYRYLQARRHIEEKEAEQFKIRRRLAELRDSTNKNEKKEYEKLKKKLKDNKKKLSDLRDEASSYSAKPIKYTSTDERLLKSHVFNDAFVNRINTANSSFRKDMVELLQESTGLDFGQLLSKDENGKYYLDKKNMDMTDEVYNPFMERLRALKTRKEGEALLTESMLGEEEYSKYREVFERVKRRGGSLGVETAEELYKLDQASKAMLFNGVQGIGNTRTLEDMEKGGFKTRSILSLTPRDLQLDTEGAKSILEEATVLDLGTRFRPENRYIALPGLGQFVGNGPDAAAVKREYQSKVGSLKAAAEEYYKFANDENYVNEDGKTLDEALQLVLNKAEDVKVALGQNLFGKTGAITQYGVAAMPMVTARQKITGTASILDGKLNLTDYLEDGGRLTKAVENSANSAINKAMFGDKSIMEWEKMGVYHDYAFASEDVFRSMGLFDQKYLGKMNMTEEEMRDTLKTKGISSLAIRYPEIYDSSMINTRIFLDETNGNNSLRFALHTMRKFNGDVDGDSASFMMLESKSGMNSMIYERYRDMGLDKQNLISQLEKDGYSYKNDYLLFEQAAIKANADAVIENVDWHEDVLSKIEKDYTKNTESMLKKLDGNIYRAKVTNLVDNKRLAAVDNTIDNMLNDAIEVLGAIDKSKFDNPDFMSKYGEIAKLAKDVSDNITATKSGYKISVTEMTNPTKLMDSALLALKDFGGDVESKYSPGKTYKELIGETGNYSIATNVRKMYNEVFIEQNNKTGAAAIGSVNVKLVPLKDASRNILSNGTSDSYIKDVSIQEIAAMVEQNAINFKKQEATGNQAAVPNINDALREYLKGDSSKGKNMLEGWFDEVSGEDAFENVYNKMYKGADDLLKSTMEGTITERSRNNGTSKAVEKSRYAVEQFFKGLRDIKNDERFKNYYSRPFGSSNTDRSAVWKVVVHDEGQVGDILNDVIGTDVYSKLEIVRDAQRQRAIKEQEAARFVNEITTSGARGSSSLAETGSSFARKLMGHKSTGLAMGVIGLASGLMVSGFAAGNPLQQDESPYLSNPNGTDNKPQSIPEFFDQQGGYAQQSNNGGYIINVRADTKQGKKQLERTMKKVAKQGFGNVNVNMSVRDKNKPKSNQDIQNWIESNL